MADAYRIVDFGVIAVASIVSIGTKRSLKPQIPTRNIKRVRHGNAALDEVIAKMIRIDGQFNKWDESQREKTTVIATDVQLKTRCDSIETGLASNCSSFEILGLFGPIGGEDQLKIKVIEQAGFDIHRRDVHRGESRIAALGVWPIVSQVREIHFNLKVSSIHCERTVGFI